MQYVYVLQNSEGNWYIGCTKDLKKRLSQHNSGQSEYTSHRGPYELVYYEACIDVKDAYARERYLKSGQGRRYLNNRLKRYLIDGMNYVKTQEAINNHQSSEPLIHVQTSQNNVSESEF